jgi:hypothetical protein
MFVNKNGRRLTPLTTQRCEQGTGMPFTYFTKGRTYFTKAKKT